MATEGFFYLVDKSTGKILLSGDLPESWANIPSINELNEESLADLAWAGYPNLAFLKETELLLLPGLEQNTVDTLKGAQYDGIWELIKAERDMRKSGGVPVTVEGVAYWFFTDEASRIQYAILDGFARRQQLPATAVLDNWKTMSGDMVPMTVSLLHTVLDAGVTREKAIFNVAEAHKTALYNAGNPNAYNWHSNWPETYEEFVKRSFN